MSCKVLDCSCEIVTKYLIGSRYCCDAEGVLAQDIHRDYLARWRLIFFVAGAGACCHSNAMKTAGETKREQVSCKSSANYWNSDRDDRVSTCVVEGRKKSKPDQTPSSIYCHSM